MDLQRKLFERLLVVMLIAVGLLSVPAVVASGTISVTLNSPTSCTLAPLGGIGSCSGSGTETNLNDQGSMCLNWAYDSNHLSVSVTGSSIGSPTSSSSFPIYNGECFGQADLPFSFTITYIKSTCDAGTYNVVFTGTKGDGSYSSATFTVYVKCVLSPTA
jgi:hypothetical protein